MSHHIVLLAAAHERHVDVQWKLLVVQLLTHVRIYQLRLLVLHILLYDVSPYFLVAVVVEADLSLIILPVIFVQLLYTAHILINELLFLTQLKNVRLVLIHAIAELADIEHAFRFPVSELSVDKWTLIVTWLERLTKLLLSLAVFIDPIKVTDDKVEIVAVKRL